MPGQFDRKKPRESRRVRELLVQLHSPEKETRMQAVTGLREHTSVPEAVHALRMSLFDPDGHVRILAAEALARAGLYPDEAIPVLVAVLEVTDQTNIAAVPHAKEWRRVAAGALQFYGSRAAPAIPALRNALLDPDYNVRGYAAISLGAIGPEAIIALQDLRAARQSEPNEGVRQVYAEAIRRVVGSAHFTVIVHDDEDKR